MTMYSKVFLIAVFLAAICHAEVKTPPALNRNRDEVLKFFAEKVYGVRPELSFERKEQVVKTEKVPSFNATRKIVKISTLTPLGEKTFTAVSYFPDGVEKCPVFIYLSFRSSSQTNDPRWPIGQILERGAATVAFCYEDVLPDKSDVLKGIKRADNSWGAISTWALAASRVVDWLETEPLADLSKIAVVGHSRLGKTSLWAGANDTRFAMTVSNNSGCFGARLHSRNLYGETIERITAVFPHWFAPTAAKLWNRKDYDLPFDQHWLAAAVAPRLLAIGSAIEDWWACPPGEMACWEYARPAWNDKSSITYHVRPGQHNITSVDWKEYLDFAARKNWFSSSEKRR
jgi:hypothetical protein